MSYVYETNCGDRCVMEHQKGSIAYSILDFLHSCYAKACPCLGDQQMIEKKTENPNSYKEQDSPVDYIGGFTHLEEEVVSPPKTQQFV
jgi:hypothetical protein